MFTLEKSQALQILDLSKSQAQTSAHRALQPGNTICLPWGRGTGKSWFIRLVWYLLVAEWDGKFRTGAEAAGIRIVLLMPTLKQAKKVHANLMLAEIMAGGQWGHLGGIVNKTDWKIEFPGGSWIQWVSAENADDNRGIRCDVVCIDEADDIDPEIVDAITKPWFSEPHSLRISIIGGTPRRGRYGLLYKAHKEWPAKNPERFKSFHTTAYDVPRLVDAGYLAEVKQTTAPEVFSREWMCDFDSAEGLVYPMFDERFHVRLPPPSQVWTEILVGADHGYEDPGVLLLIGVIGKGRDAICWVLDEVYERHKDPTWWLDKVRERVGWYPAAKWYADPARADLIASWKKAGARMQAVDNAIEEGVSAVADRLVIRHREDGSRHTRTFIHPSCVNLIEEFGKYRRKRDPRNKERILDDIEDRNNHAMDAIRYPILGRFPEAGASGRNRTTFEDRAA